jgi:hypothetical protein
MNPLLAKIPYAACSLRRKEEPCQLLNRYRGSEVRPAGSLSLWAGGSVGETRANLQESPSVGFFLG